MALNPRIVLAPHFPALLMDEERGDESRIHEALRNLGRQYTSDGVDAVVLLSAQWSPEGPFQVDNGTRHKTLLDLEGIRASLHYTCAGWSEMANALHDNGMANGLPVETVHRGMDHGASVPLSYVFPEARCQVVPISASERSPDDFRLWGEVVRETCRGADAAIALMVGGSLSYDAAAHAAGEDRPGGVELDRAILGRLEAGDWDGIGSIPSEVMEKGRPHAALRHLWFLRGVLGQPVPGRILAYHRHPSVGSAVIEFELPE